MKTVENYDKALESAKLAVVKAFARFDKPGKRKKVFEIAEKLEISPALVWMYARGEGTNLRRYLEIKKELF